MQHDEEDGCADQEDGNHHRELEGAAVDQAVEVLQQAEGVILEGDGLAADQQVAEAAEEQLGGQRDDHGEELLEAGDQEAVDRAAEHAHQQAGRDGQREGQAVCHTADGERAVEHRQHHHAQRGDRAHGDVHVAQRQNQHHAQRHEGVEHVRAQGLDDVGEVEHVLLGQARRKVGGVLQVKDDADQGHQADQEEFPALEEGFYFFHQMFLLARSCLLAMRWRMTFSRIANSSRIPFTNSVIMELPMPSIGMALSIRAIITAPITTPVILP